MNTKIFLEKNSSKILAGFSVTGVIGTAIVTAKRTPKAIQLLEGLGEEPTKKEKAEALLQAYWPVIFIAGLTCTGIIGAEVLNEKQIQSLGAAYGYLAGLFTDYRKEVAHRHGREEDKEIMESLVPHYSNYHVTNDETPDRKILWYEPHTKVYFYAYEKEVIDAKMHINRNFSLGGEISLNQWLDMLGIDPVENGDDLLWTMEDGYVWIDFDDIPKRMPDGTEYYEISPTFDAYEMG